MLKLINLSRLWVSGSPTSTSPPRLKDEPDTVEKSPFNFLALPLDLRLEIYLQISQPSPSGDPSKNPLYKLLFVSPQLRDEVSSLLYNNSSGLVFSSPSKCKSFLALTAANLHLLTSLAITVPNGDAYSLEPIFKMIHEGGAHLRCLVLVLQCQGKKGLIIPNEKDVLPRLTGEQALDRARERAQHLETTYERTTRKDKLSNSKELPYKAAPVEDLIVEKWPGCLGNLVDIRYLAIDGNPHDNWSVEFELAVLGLHERMFKMASRNGYEEMEGGIPSWYGRWGDWYWFGSRKFVMRGGLVRGLGEMNPLLR